MVTNITNVHSARKCIVAAEVKRIELFQRDAIGERVDCEDYFSHIYTLVSMFTLFYPQKLSFFYPTTGS